MTILMATRWQRAAECDREAARQSDDEMIARQKLTFLHYVPNGEPELPEARVR